MIVEFLAAWGKFYLFTFLIALVGSLLLRALAGKGGGWAMLAKAIFIPGAAVHEGGHLLACLLTGRKVVAVNWGLNGHMGFVAYKEDSGIQTPLATHLVAYAPVLSCGTASVLVFKFLSDEGPTMTLGAFAFWVYLLVAFLAAAAPSWQDMKIALGSIAARPRVTLVEVLSFAWPAFLPGWLGLVGDASLLPYVVAIIGSYAVLWRLLVTPWPYAPKVAGAAGLPGDGRARSLSPGFAGAIRGGATGPSPAPPQLPSLGRGVLALPRSPLPTATDVYAAAGLKPRERR